MEKRNLGLTGIELSAIGFGTNYVGGHNLYEGVDEAAGVALVKQAIEQGITHIDTADAYGFGRSEELVGQAIKGHRSEVILATKGSRRFGEHGDGFDNSPEYLRAALHRSLKRLDTDYIDLYYMHFRDDSTPADEAFGALLEFKEEGLIRAAGVSNWDVASLDLATQAGPIDAFQARYNLLQRDAEAELIPWCERNQTTFIPWGPLAFGLLGGKYQRDFKLDEGDWRVRSGAFDEGVFERNLDVVDDLKELATQLDSQPAQLAIQWTLAQPVVGSVIAGAKRGEQLQANIAAGDAGLGADAVRRMNDMAPAAV